MAEFKTVEEYIRGLSDWRGQVVSAVRAIILSVAPQAAESIKWSQPVYETNGPFAYIKAFKNHVNFGFWRGVDLTDDVGILEGSGDKMRHIKLTGMDDVRESVFQDLVREAVELNETHGSPTRRS